MEKPQTQSSPIVIESPIADPGPLGLAAFAVTTFILSLNNAKITAPELAQLFVPLALFYGGLTQLLAGMWEFKKNNTFGATAFSTYGAFWLALGALKVMENLKIVTYGSSGKTGVGVFLIAFAIFTLYMWVATFRINWALFTVFTLLEIAFVLLILADLGFITSEAGGYVGLATAAGAWYVSAAGVLNPLYKRILLPLGPRN
ncbi:MAG: acetate uptake transporter [Chloroflexi bacterium]|nr:acetate uptake transporter [Chloroflexota bacterium]